MRTKYLTMLLAGAAFMASAAAASADGYTIGVSNTVQGNGWREEMICAIKAQALASGKVAKLNIAHRNTDAAGQSEDIRNLISAGVNAIVVNPADPAGIQAALAEATKAGIVVVAVDQAVTEPSAYIISNNQEEYAYLGAKWLFETLDGKGSVVYMRGAAGASADSDRDKGFKRALAEFPDIKVAQEVFTGWQQDQGIMPLYNRSYNFLLNVAKLVEAPVLFQYFLNRHCHKIMKANELRQFSLQISPMFI